MRLKPKLLPCLMVISIVGLSACNNDKSSNNQQHSPAPTTKTITVSPSLGKISKGRVLLKNLAGQAITEVKDISANGTATFTVDANKLLGPIIAEVLPALDGKLIYADEAITDKLVTLSGNANTAVLRAATTITRNNTNIGVTALTEAALNYAQSLSAQLTKANIDTANQKIADQLKLTKFNITDAPAIVGLNDFSPLINQNITETQRAYAAYLATLAKEAKRLNATSTQPAYDILQAFSKDFSDGVFDGKQNTTPLTTYNNSFITAWAKWVETFYASIFNLKNASDLSAWLAAFNAQTPNIPPINPNPTTCTTGVTTKFTTTVSTSPYSNGQTVCFVASTTSLGFNNKTLTNPVRNTAVQLPFSAYIFTDGNYKYEVAFNNTTLHEINLLDGSTFIGQFEPTTTTPVTETCASKKLPVATLSSITAYDGDYKDQGATVFSLKIATASAVVKGTQTATIKEVCGPNPQSNGINHVVITDKGSVTLFKTNTGTYSAEGFEFTDKTKVFYGEKSSSTSTLCESNGADDKLGFKNAPNDFCTFSKASSVAITSPDVYTFFNADKKENVKVTVEGTSVKSVQIENNSYAWACGVGSLPACTGVVFSTANANFNQIAFQNTVLKVINGATQDLTIKNGLLIHQQSTTPTITFNTAACPRQVTATTWYQCGAGITADFTSPELKVATLTGLGTSCKISKTNDTLTFTANGASYSAKLDGELTDDYSTSPTGGFDQQLTAAKNGTIRIDAKWKNGVITGATYYDQITSTLIACRT
jgi:hypothetical protein